ncbi:RNA-directed DNA polymerase, eukaryota, reverse transcriptase zinc-binding domain protein [Tanacetum coccineum]
MMFLLMMKEMRKGIKDIRLEMDKCFNEQRQLSCNETEDSTYDMKEYFKYRWKEMYRNKCVIETHSDEHIECKENEAPRKLVADEIDEVDTWSVQRNVKFFCSFIYASNSGRKRQELWRDLHTHKGIINNRPWVLMGDFNVTLKPNENSSHYQNSFGVFYPFMISDHSPAVITIPKGLRKKRKSFRFVNNIADKKDFIECVKREWETYVIGCNMYKVGQKLKRSKKPTANTSGNKKKSVELTKEVSNLNPFDVFNSVENDGDLGTNGGTSYLASNGANSNGSSFWNVKTSSTSTTPIVDKIGKIEKLIIDGKVTLVDDDGKPLKKIDYPGDHDSEDEVESVDNDMARSLALERVLNEYMEASNDELKLLQQKAKIKWLSEGDQNTTYFHGILKSRNHKGRIESICDENGIRYDGDKVVEAFVEHFKKFFCNKKHAVQPLSSVDINFEKVISKDEAKDMISMVTNYEIKKAIFDIDSNKASGPDGYTFGFFKKSWSIIGKEAIACCNVIYKSISKILTNRIKNKLQKVVNLNPSAFIPEIHIQDNILIAQELLKGYKSKNGDRRRALKIDIQKAYDTISWDFLKEVLGRFGFLHLKGVSIWDIKAIHNDSCGWKKLLDLRNVFYSVGNGMNVSMWFDRWDIKGPLSDIIPRRVWYEERFSVNEKVAHMIDKGAWIWPASWYNRFPDLCNINVPLLSNDDTDKVLWLNNQNEKKEFFTKQAWCDLRDNVDKVDWYYVVWFNQFQPRHAFILWLASLKRLATQDRLAKWNCISNLECPLCNKERDSHAHLFFKCDYQAGMGDVKEKIDEYE